MVEIFIETFIEEGETRGLIEFFRYQVENCFKKRNIRLTVQHLYPI